MVGPNHTPNPRNVLVGDRERLHGQNNLAERQQGLTFSIARAVLPRGVSIEHTATRPGSDNQLARLVRTIDSIPSNRELGRTVGPAELRWQLITPAFGSEIMANHRKASEYSNKTRRAQDRGTLKIVKEMTTELREMQRRDMWQDSETERMAYEEWLAREADDVDEEVFDFELAQSTSERVTLYLSPHYVKMSPTTLGVEINRFDEEDRPVLDAEIGRLNALFQAVGVQGLRGGIGIDDINYQIPVFETFRPLPRRAFGAIETPRIPLSGIEFQPLEIHQA